MGNSGVIFTYTLTRRPCFINGLPLIFIELKGVHRKLENAYRNNLKDYKDTIPQLFWYNAFIILSNGSESRIGTVTADYEYFSEWKKINSEGEEGIVSLDTIIKGTCEKTNFLDLLENFILFHDTGGSIVKILTKNHQYLGMNNAIESFKKIKENQGRLGVFWHTQGSGKSFSMIFFSRKILRKFKDNYTFLIVTIMSKPPDLLGDSQSLTIPGLCFVLIRDIELLNISVLTIVMPEWFCRASSHKTWIPAKCTRE
ncbi:MAG: type I restriction endonuclease subunit R [Nitrospinae bacterium]|nr:type I restriction endonuclease subunit R [Nitrospinota bacterium]